MVATRSRAGSSQSSQLQPRRQDPTTNQDTPLPSVESQSASASTSAPALASTSNRRITRSASATATSANIEAILGAVDQAPSANPPAPRYPLRGPMSPTLKVSRGVKRGRTAETEDEVAEDEEHMKPEISTHKKQKKNNHTSAPSAARGRGSSATRGRGGGRGGKGKGKGKGKAEILLQAIEESPVKMEPELEEAQASTIPFPVQQQQLDTLPSASPQRQPEDLPPSVSPIAVEYAEHTDPPTPTKQVDQSTSVAQADRSKTPPSVEHTANAEVPSIPSLPDLTSPFLAAVERDTTNARSNHLESTKRKAPHNEFDYDSLSDGDTPTYNADEWRVKKDRIRKAMRFIDTGEMDTGELPRKKQKMQKKREPEVIPAQRTSMKQSSPQVLLSPPPISSQAEPRLTNESMIDKLRTVHEWAVSNESSSMLSAEQKQIVNSLTSQITAAIAASSTQAGDAMNNKTTEVTSSGTYAFPEETESESDVSIINGNDEVHPHSATKAPSPVVNDDEAVEQRQPTVTRMGLFPSDFDGGRATAQIQSVSTVNTHSSSPQTPTKSQSVEPAKGWFTSVKKAVSRFSFFGHDTPETSTANVEEPEFTFTSPSKVPAMTPIPRQAAGPSRIKFTPTSKISPMTPVPRQAAGPSRINYPQTERPAHKRNLADRQKRFAGQRRIMREEKARSEKAKEANSKGKGKGKGKAQEWGPEIDNTAGGAIPPERLAEMEAQQGAQRESFRAEEEARFAAKSPTHSGTYQFPDDEDDDDDDEQQGKVPIPQGQVPVPIPQLPPRPDHDWENDDRWGFDCKGHRFSRLQATEPGPNYPHKFFAPTVTKRSDVKVPGPCTPFINEGLWKGRIIQRTLEVDQWIESDRKWRRLETEHSHGRLTQEMVTAYHALLNKHAEALREDEQAKAEAAANPPPTPRPANAALPKPVFTNPYAPKTPSALRTAETAYSSPVEVVDENEIRGHTNLTSVSKEIIALVDEREAREPLVPLPFPTRQDFKGPQALMDL